MTVVLDERTEPWGNKMRIAAIKDVAISERWRDGPSASVARRIIGAEGGLQASEKLGSPAAVLGREPAALKLCYLLTLVGIGSE